MQNKYAKGTLMSRICQESDCDRLIGNNGARGYCPMHYKRLLRQGNPSIPYPSRPRYSIPNRPGEKVCARCEISKPISEYRLRPGKQQGQPMAYCRPCEKERSHAKKRAPTSSKTKSPIIRNIQKFDGDPIKKRRARARLRNAISAGHIQKKPCQECGEIKVDAHHYLGYDGEHWKDVIWLCRFHHFKLHGFLTESYIKQVEETLNA